MSNKISAYKNPKRRGYRYRKQINGRVYDKYFTGNKDQREHAYKIWVKMLEEQHARRRIDNSVTFHDFRDIFIKNLFSAKDKTTGKPSFSKRTIEEYRYSLADFERAMEVRYAGDVDYYMLADYRRKCRTLADANKENYYGVNKKVGSTIRALKWGMAEGLINVFNTAPLEEKLDTGEVIVKTLTPAQVALMVKYSSDKWRVAIKIGFCAGLRPEEMMNLLVEKINFQTGITRIWEHKADKARGITAWSPKRDKRRLVFLAPDILADIKSLSPKTYVLTNKHGDIFDSENFAQAFKKNLRLVNRQIALHEADTKPISCTYKTLRKSNITALMEMGLAEKDASLSLGHADKKTSEKHYINAETLAKRQEREQMERLERIREYLCKLPETLKQC